MRKNFTKRHISKLDLFEVLQKEWFEALLRKTIHHNKANKKYYKKVMNRKKIKIESISADLGLSNIFEDENYYQEIRTKIYPNDKRRLPQIDLTSDDLKLYFSKGVDVKIFEDGNFKVGKIMGVRLESNMVSVKVKGENNIFPTNIKNILRLF